MDNASPKSSSFEELIVWQKAHSLVLSVYKVSSSFPKEELFGLTSQLRRAAVSIAANIAEGYKRSGKPDKQRFFNISEASLSEVRYYVILGHDLGYLNRNDFVEQMDEVAKLLSSYKRAIK